MDRQQFPPLKAFDAPDVEHVTVWTAPHIQSLCELLPRHRHCVTVGQLALSEDPKALVLERFA